MGRRVAISLLLVVLAAFMATPALAQDAYPPPEGPEVLDRQIGGEDFGVGGAEPTAPAAPAAPTAPTTEVRGVALEASALPVTGATLGLLAALGLGVLVAGGFMVTASRRRVRAE
jgi:LPXTG-motif cell wall-anchored protein